MIEIKNIHKSYGSLEVLKGIDAVIEQGEIVSIVGASGAGKTTLLQIVGTLDKPDCGEILYDGRRVDNLPDREMARFRNGNIGFVFQFHQLLPEFTALENVMIPALIGGKKPIGCRTGSQADTRFPEPERPTGTQTGSTVGR